MSVGHRKLTVQDLTQLHADAGLAPEIFVERWATDSLLAEAARAGALHSTRINQVERSVLARTLLDSLFERAKNMGEPTERELETVSSEFWLEVNRPVAAQTTHFVVRQKTERDKSSAEALARALAQAVRGVKNAERFKEIVEKHPRGGLEVVVESLPPVTRDGRSFGIDADGKTTGPGPKFDAAFARAANLLATAGEQSGLVRTEFGFHVILLERKIPGFTASPAALKERFTSEVHSRRARHAVEEIIQDARRANRVTLESSFQQAIAQLQVVQ